MQMKMRQNFIDNEITVIIITYFIHEIKALLPNITF